MHIDVVNGGELQVGINFKFCNSNNEKSKIGSPSCRYKSDLDIELYGTRAEQLELEASLDRKLFCLGFKTTVSLMKFLTFR